MEINANQKKMKPKWQDILFIYLAYLILTSAMTSPIASYKLIPGENTDFPTHIGSIIQAKMALDQHQYPPRTGPWEDHGWGNAWFQFYAPIPHTFAAIIYRTFSPRNPFIAFKVVIWIALFISGVFIYKLTDWFLDSKITAFLSGVVYMTAPYFLININVRGDFKEAIAQGLLPMVIFFTLRNFLDKTTLSRFFLTAALWGVLACTCLLTFIYSSLFVGLLLIFITVCNRHRWKSFLLTSLAYVYACVLALWFLAPAGLMESYLQIDNELMDPIKNNLFTGLSTLLSPTAVSPVPADPWWRSLHLYPAIGWPILTAVGVLIYALITRRLPLNREKKTLLISLLILLFSAFTMTWSLLDFWSLLPKFLTVTQFPYRLLTQVMWIGTILFGFAFYWLFDKQVNIRHAILGFLVLGIFAGSWLPTEGSGKNNIYIKELINSPSFDYGKNEYLPEMSKFKKEIMPLSSPNLDVSTTSQVCGHENNKTICQINLKENTLVQLPVLYYPKLLDIRINGQKIAYFPSQHQSYLLATLKLAPGNYLIQSYFRGFWWANWISGIAWLFCFLALMSLLAHKCITYLLLRSVIPAEDKMNLRG